jgi:hypothetical protein
VAPKFMAVEERVVKAELGEQIRQQVRAERRALRKAQLPDRPMDMALPEIDKIVEAHAQPAITKLIRRRARAILAENLPEYARLHLAAAREAASKGNAIPAQWALESVKPGGEAPVVEPAAKDLGGSGVKIILGIQIGGLGTLGVVSASNEEKANDVQAEMGRLPEPRVIEGTVVG